MTSPQAPQSTLAAILAVVAALAGTAALIVAAVGLARSIDSEPEPALPPPTTASAQATIVDDSGTLSVVVPLSWSEVSGTPWSLDGSEVGPSLAAAPDLDAWYETWGIPGTFIGVSTGPEPDPGDFGGVCEPGQSRELVVADFIGQLTAWSECGEARSDFVTFLGTTDGTAPWLLIQLVAVDGDVDPILDRISTTLSYIPTP